MFGIKRRGFAMILAILVVVLVAMGGMILLSSVSTTGKAVGDNYLRAQSELLAVSATEFAVMRAQGFDTTASGHCLEHLNIDVKDSGGTVSTYDINVTINYSFKGAKPGGCNNVLAENTGKDTMMLIDTTVSTNGDTNLSIEPLRVHNRTWQKL